GGGGRAARVRPACPASAAGSDRRPPRPPRTGAKARGALGLLGGGSCQVAGHRARGAVRRGDLLLRLRADEAGARDLSAHGARARRRAGRLLLRRRRRERRAGRRAARRHDPRGLPAVRGEVTGAGGAWVAGSTDPIDGGGARAVLITTMNDIPGYTIDEVFGEVFGLTVRSRNLGSQMGAGLKSMLGGELKGMTKALE